MFHKRLSRTVIYESSWVNLYVDRVVFPEGAIIEKHHYLDFKRASVAIIIENDNSELLFIEAYRYVTDSIEWEIPGGVIEEGETIIQAAEREALEETGYSIIEPEFIYSYNPSNGISNKVFNIVKAKASTNIGSFDKNEVKSIKWVSINEIKEMIKNKEIKDGFALTALLLYLANL